MLEQSPAGRLHEIEHLLEAPRRAVVGVRHVQLGRRGVVRGAPVRARGIALEGAAREVTLEDFADFDLLIAMDRSNLRALRQLAPSEEARAKVRLLREFDPASTGRARPPGANGADSGRRAARDASVGDLDVPDPYYGAAGGFEEVLDLVQAACEGLLEHVRAGEPA